MAAGEYKNEATFDQNCAFVFQRRNGRVAAMEADRPVKATIAGQAIDLAAFTPVTLE